MVGIGFAVDFFVVGICFFFKLSIVFKIVKDKDKDIFLIRVFFVCFCKIFSSCFFFLIFFCNFL